MTRVRRLLAPLLAIAAAGLAATAAELPASPPAHHALTVRLDPAHHAIRVSDELDLSGAPAGADGGYRFTLHAGLAPRVATAGWRLTKDFREAEPGDVPLEAWRLIPPASGGADVAIEYGGAIDHPVAVGEEEYQRGFSETPGTIEERGVYLAGATHWVPTFGEALVTFDLEVDGLAPLWDVVSAGERTRHETAAGERTTAWRSTHPVEEIHLVAGPWIERDDRAGAVPFAAFLREDDPALAARYLDAGKRYLRMYEGILPRFPWPSFSLVENFWETGYGMPGFTLLGPKIIRMPWILTSSYPHELLHNWWGNSVYVAPQGGNWSEGLTAYMADHLFAEQSGEAETYRRTTLQKYADFVRGNNDFPLAAFTSRRSAASEAVGYGKAMMLFHMVRRTVGDAVFLERLSRFADAHRYARASFRDVAEAFAGAGETDWPAFFETWTTRTGAPALELSKATVRPATASPGAFTLDLEIRQTQAEDPFPLVVPVAITVAGREEPILKDIPSTERVAAASIDLPSRPLRVTVDPSFDLMRRVDPLEVPPALSSLLGDEDPLFVIPSRARAVEAKAWRDLAAAWTHGHAPRVVTDAETAKLPEGTVWLLGWDNALVRDFAEELADPAVTARADGVTIDGTVTSRTGRSAVLVARRRADARKAVGWIAADPIAAIPGLARKLPHYSRYSWLLFKGDEPENTGKGAWAPHGSPLVRDLAPGGAPPLRLPARKPLADLPAVFDGAAMQRTVESLASPEMAGRGAGSAGLDRALALVERAFTDMKLTPAGDAGYRQSFKEGTNLLGALPGSDAALADHPVVVLAHLDHLGSGGALARAGNDGKMHPGADDNASGVAVLLELARSMAAEPRGVRPVLFAVVSGEEIGLLGSRHFISTRAPERLPFACVNLDTVGRLRDGKLYALNTDSAREWRFIFMGIQATTGMPITIVPEPLDSSDQTACLESGVPAVQLFTGPNADYHRPSDTPEKIDADGMARVAEAAHEAVAYLASRAEPLTVKLAAAGAAAAPGAASPAPPARRAGMGCVPDFAFAGPGVRVQDVVADSPAAKAGLMAGDILLSFGGAEIAGLKGYSDLLKAHAPGDIVEVVVKCGEQKLTMKVTLAER
ncbi:MAG: M28 family peptidase [Acidobacteria bacterium]|nr:M28 family peptidase [Acidobacteriota bacterium]